MFNIINECFIVKEPMLMIYNGYYWSSFLRMHKTYGIHVIIDDEDESQLFAVN